MINSYPVNTNSEIGVIETIYEKFETQSIRKSVCTCHCPWKSTIKNASCTFYDANGAEISTVVLPNARIYAYYTNHDGITISKDEKNIILYGWHKGDTACYSIDTKKLVWESEITKVSKIFLYDNLLFCQHVLSTRRENLSIIAADTGEFKEEVLTCKMQDALLPDFQRLSKNQIIVHIMGFIYIYNMQSRELSMSPLRINENCEYLCLLNVYAVSTETSIFQFKRFDKATGNNLYFDMNVDKRQLVENAQKSLNQSKIRANKKDLEKEYNVLFGRVI